MQDGITSEKVDRGQVSLRLCQQGDSGPYISRFACATASLQFAETQSTSKLQPHYIRNHTLSTGGEAKVRRLSLRGMRAALLYPQIAEKRLSEECGPTSVRGRSTRPAE